VTDDEIAREHRAEELREEIERLSSGEVDENPPRTPRELTEGAARREADAAEEEDPPRDGR
jgi:hypothetical protein